jgi:ParB/Sulfiredoxin domain
MNGEVGRCKNLRWREHSSQSSLDLKIVYRRIDEVKPDPTNPRLHTKKQIRQIADSVKTFDFNVPILIDRDDNVITGHGRLGACRELGWSEVPTLCLDHRIRVAAGALFENRADNKLARMSVVMLHVKTVAFRDEAEGKHETTKTEPNLARNRKFESSSLQQRVNKLSVSSERAALRFPLVRGGVGLRFSA